MNLDYYSWLRNLKPGDEVALTGGYGGAGDTTAISKVRSADSYTGKVVVRDMEFENGRYSEGLLGETFWITPVTSSALNEVKKQKLVNKLHNVNWKDYPIGVLENILNNLDNY